MRQIVTLIVVLAVSAVSGCATGLQGVALLSTAGRGAAPSAFSEFATDLQNYSAGVVAASSSDECEQAALAYHGTPTGEAVSGSPQTEGTAGNDTLPVAPEPGALADLYPAAGYDPGPLGDSAEQLETGADAPDASAAVPVAPGPEAVVGVGLESGVDPVRDTGCLTNPDTASCVYAEPAADVESVPYPPVAPDVEAIAYTEGDAEFEADVYTESGPEPAFGPQVAEACPEYLVAEQVEVVPAPHAAAPSPFKPGEDDSDIDRFTRRIADVPLDIRPTEGVMPGDLAADEFEQHAQSDPRQSCEVDPIVCSCTPWTICFRPLYFEEPALERLGEKCRFIQPAVSGVHFFSSVALLPYKMRVRPPRSCVCSNGFSRIGDPVPPGYGECVWRWDAAAIEAAAVTGFVFILP